MKIEIGKTIPDEIRDLIHRFLTGPERMDLIRSFGVKESTGRSVLNQNRNVSEKTIEMVEHIKKVALDTRRKSINKSKKIA